MSAAEMKGFPSGFKCNSCQWCGSSMRLTCPSCGSSNLLRQESAGAGEVVDFVPVLYPPENLKDLGSYISVLVKFREGFKRFCISSGKPSDFSIGCAVTVTRFDEDTQRLFIDRA